VATLRPHASNRETPIKTATARYARKQIEGVSVCTTTGFFG
jgi:hypothetical protein